MKPQLICAGAFLPHSIPTKKPDRVLYTCVVESAKTQQIPCNIMQCADLNRKRSKCDARWEFEVPECTKNQEKREVETVVANKSAHAHEKDAPKNPKLSRAPDILPKRMATFAR